MLHEESINKQSVPSSFEKAKSHPLATPSAVAAGAGAASSAGLSPPWPTLRRSSPLVSCSCSASASVSLASSVNGAAFAKACPSPALVATCCTASPGSCLLVLPSSMMLSACFSLRAADVRIARSRRLAALSLDCDGDKTPSLFSSSSSAPLKILPSSSSSPSLPKRSRSSLFSLGGFVVVVPDPATAEIVVLASPAPEPAPPPPPMLARARVAAAAKEMPRPLFGPTTAADPSEGGLTAPLLERPLLGVLGLMIRRPADEEVAAPPDGSEIWP